MAQCNVLYGPRTHVKLTEKNVAKLIIDKITNNQQDHPLLIDGEETISNKRFLKLCRNLTWSLHTLGIDQDDVVALIAENSWKFCVTMVSTFALGSPLHVLNPEYTYYEFKHLLELTQPKLVFCTYKSYNTILKLKQELKYLRFIVLLDLDGEEQEAIPFDVAVNVEGVTQQFFGVINPSTQPVLIHNSSGTTGLPKAVKMTHESYSFAYLYQLFDEYCYTKPHQNHLIYLPLFHGYGTYLMLSGLCVSNTTAVILKRFRPDDFFASISIYKIRSVNVVPTILNFMANTSLDEKYNLDCLKEIVCSGAASRDVDNVKVCEKYGLKSVRNLYGMGEGVVCITIMPPDEYRKGCIGKLYPERELKVVDRKTGQSLGPGKVGELCVKNPTMAGYVNNLEKTVEALDGDGYLYTGDAGYYDEEGYIYLVDRIKDLIKYKGFQVAPSELEILLLKHPSIKDVAVVGKPDERVGELPMAFVVRKMDEDVSEEQIHEYLKEFVSGNKRLHGGVKFVEAIPKNPTGKILRTCLRQMVEEEHHI